jgi:hypothetical protein
MLRQLIDTRIRLSVHMSPRFAVLRDFADIGLLVLLIGPVWCSLAYPPGLPGAVRQLMSSSVAAVCVLAPYVLAVTCT